MRSWFNTFVTHFAISIFPCVYTLKYDDISLCIVYTRCTIIGYHLQIESKEVNVFIRKYQMINYNDVAMMYFQNIINFVFKIDLTAII